MARAMFADEDETRDDAFDNDDPFDEGGEEDVDDDADLDEADVEDEARAFYRGSRYEAPGLFDDEPPPAPDCARDGHDWRPTVTVWPNETTERLTWTCRRCGTRRGRA